jgi:NagD protein
MKNKPPAVTSDSVAKPSSIEPDEDESTLLKPAQDGPTLIRSADIRSLKGFIIDMDGVVYHHQKLIEGTLEFISWLQRNKKKFLFLTNSSERTPRELQEKLHRMGIHVTSSHFYTSALATASFLARQRRNAISSVYAIGEAGLITALHDAGFSMNDTNPDYVVVGETRSFHYAQMELAVKLVRNGARLIGTNCDITDRSVDGFIPACGSLIKPIELASGRSAYFIGKPNPLMMRAALSKLEVSRQDACIIGDRMDTDILAGIESEIKTVLVLTGVTSLHDLQYFPYRPDCVLPSAYHILSDDQEVNEKLETAKIPRLVGERGER